jgi:hypothetical protein
MLSLNQLWARVRSVLQWRVKRWHVSQRGWDEKDIRVLICLEDSIWYWALLEWIVWDNFTWVCMWTDYIKVPMFIRNWKRVWDAEWDEEPCTFDDYYGDSLHSIWHCGVCDPSCQWVWKHKFATDRKEVQWELTLDEARAKFADNPEVYRWVEKDLEEHKLYDAEKAAEEAAKSLAENSQ